MQSELILITIFGLPVNCTLVRGVSFSKIMINRYSLFFFYCAFLTLLSCTGPIEKKELTIENPTNYVFNVSKAELKEKIITFFNEHNYLDSEFYESSVFYFEIDGGDGKMPVSFSAETSENPVFGKSYFYGQKTSDDIFLYAYAYWPSPIYHSRGKPLEFRSNYIVKLTSIDSTHTRVSVVAKEPEVVNGTECCGMHGPYAKTFPVKATSIEEYTLIVFIAEQLGVRHLKSVNLDTKGDL
jgi:hypothetical protein